MSADDDSSSGTSLHEGIARLESELEELEAAAERCRRTILLARVAAAGGSLLLVLAVWRADATLLVTGIAVVLGGFARGGLGRLLVACHEGDGLAYVGGVGTGFTETVARELRRSLDAIRREKPAVPLKVKRIVWVDPVLVAEVEFRGWTGDGMLRHASYKGLRDRADAAEVHRR